MPDFSLISMFAMMSTMHIMEIVYIMVFYIRHFVSTNSTEIGMEPNDNAKK